MVKKLNKIIRIPIYFIVALLLLFLVIVGSVNLPPVHRFLTDKTNSILQQKGIPLHIGKITLLLNGKVGVSGTELITNKSDTIVYAGNISINIRPTPLLSKRIVVESVNISQAVVNIIADTATGRLNIVSAFLPGEKQKHKPAPTVEPDKNLKPWEIEVKKINLNNISFKYFDQSAGILVVQNVKKASAQFKGFSILNKEIFADELILDQPEGLVEIWNTGFKKTETKSNPLPWKFSLNNLAINQLKFCFNQPDTKQQFNFLLKQGNLELKSLDLASRYIDVEKIEFEKPEISIITAGTLKDPKTEKESLAISFPQFSWNMAAGEISVDDGSFQLTNSDKNQAMQTWLPVTEINTKIENISLTPTGNQFEITKLDANLNNSLTVHSGMMNLKTDSVQSIFLSAQIEATVKNKEKFFFLKSRDYKFTTNINGSVNELNINDLTFYDKAGEIFTVNGLLSNILIPDEAACDLRFQTGNLSRSRIQNILAMFNQKIQLPNIQPVAIYGEVKNSLMQPMFLVNLKSGSGNVSIDGNFNTKNKSINAVGTFQNIMMSELLGKNLPSNVSGNIAANGSFLNVANLNGEGSIHLDSVTYNGKTIQNISLAVTALKNHYDFNLAATDTALTTDLKGFAEIDNENFSGRVSGKMSLKPDHAGLTMLPVSGCVEMDAAFSKNENEIQTDITLKNIELQKENSIAKINHIHFELNNSDTIFSAKLESDFLNAESNSNSSVFTVIDALKNSNIQYAFNLDSTNFFNPSAASNIHEFNLKAISKYHPVFNLFIPDSILNFSELKIELQKKGTNDFLHGNISSDFIAYGPVKAHKPEVVLKTGSDRLNIALNIDSIAGQKLTFGKTEAAFDILPQKTSGKLNINNKSGNEIYRIGIDLRKTGQQFLCSSPFNSWLLNGNEWKILNTELLAFDNATNDVSVQLMMQNDSHEVNVNGKKSDKIEVVLKAIDLEKMIAPGLLQYNVKGILNADILYKKSGNYNIDFDLGLSDFSIDSLTINQITAKGNIVADSAGLLNGLANFVFDDSASVKIELGSPLSKNSGVVKSKFNNLSFTVLEPFFSNYLSHLHGTSSGEILIRKENERYILDGEIRLNNVGTKLNMLQTWLFIPDDKIEIADNVITLNKFTVLDSMRRPLTLNGNINFRDQENILIDMKADADQLHVLHTSEKDNPQFFGNIVVNSGLQIKGPLLNPEIKGEVMLDNGTNVTYQLIQDLSVKNMDENVLFAKFDDSLNVMIPIDATKNKSVKMPLIQTTIEINPKSIFNVKINDIYNVDITVSGNGSLYYNILPNNTVRMNGTYLVNNGKCDLKITGWPLKNFVISPESSLRWNGQIDNPELNIEATSKVKGSYLNPIDNENRTVDFVVSMKILNQLSNLAIVFGISSSDQYITSVINSLSDDERMQQAVNLLLFETIQLPGIENSTDYLSAQINSFWESQLNSITKTSLKKTELSFGIDTYTESTTSGKQEKTNFTYEMERKFMKERASVKISGRLNDYGDTGYKTTSLFENFIFEYTLDKKNQKFLKLYQKKDYQDMLEGEVIKHGIGFLYRKSYNRMKDIWKRKKMQIPEPVETENK